MDLSPIVDTNPSTDHLDTCASFVLLLALKPTSAASAIFYVVSRVRVASENVLEIKISNGQVTLAPLVNTWGPFLL